MKKRMLFLALTLAALVAMFALTASAAERCGDYYYTVSGGKASITGVESYLAGDVVIPATLDGYPVTSVTIPSSVTSIGDSAFWTGPLNKLIIYGYSGSTAETYAANNNITFVALDGNAVPPTITRQPFGTNGWNASTYYAGDDAAPMTVEAVTHGGGTLSYAWYKADSADGEGVKVGDGQSHVPDTTTAGTYYYYAIVTCTRTNNAGVTATASTKSAVITVIVHARTILSGSYTSYDPDAPARIELLQNGNLQMATYSSSANSGSGQATLNFAFTLTTPGTYTLRIVKGGHLTATVTGITVDGTSDITLDPITLSAGDVNGDGVINVADVALLRMADNYGKSADDCVLDFTAP